MEEDTSFVWKNALYPLGYNNGWHHRLDPYVYQ